MQVKSIEIVGDSGTTYTLDTDPKTGQPRCSCPAFIYSSHDKPCKHMKFVAQHTTYPRLVAV